MTRRHWWWLLVLALAAGLPSLACESDTTDPAQEGVPEDMLRFLRLPEDLAPLETRDTSFWAVRGENTRFVLHYLPAAGETEGEEFLTFDIHADGLYRKPSGAPFAEGDSIQIHVTVDDAGRFLFDFQPSGLIFNPSSPAEIEVEYRRLEGDLDGDGDVDTDDDDFEDGMRLWKQEAPGELWYPVGTIIFEETDEIEGVITSFTGFAVAV